MADSGIPAMKGRGRGRGLKPNVQQDLPPQNSKFWPPPEAETKEEEQPKGSEEVPSQSTELPAPRQKLELAFEEAEKFLSNITNDIIVRAASKNGDESKEGSEHKEEEEDAKMDVEKTEDADAKNKIKEEGKRPAASSPPEKKQVPTFEEKLMPLSDSDDDQEKVVPLSISSFGVVVKSSTIPNGSSLEKQVQEQELTINNQQKRIVELQENIEKLKASSVIRSAIVTGFEQRCRDALATTFDLILKDFHSTVSLVRTFDCTPQVVEQSAQPKMIMGAVTAADQQVPSEPMEFLPFLEIRPKPQKKSPTPAFLEALKMVTEEDLAELQNIDFAD